jgi:hypothetical protein
MPDDTADKERNEKVYGWVRGRLGTRVGKGECWDLADGALREAGAHSSTTTGKKDDYVWGRRVEVSAVMRGDILQFRNYTVKKTVATKITYADGGTETRDETSSMTRGHHTAIVAANNGAKGLEIFEQNAPEGSPVTQGTLYIKKGVLSTETTQRSVLRDDGKRVLATIVKTTTVQVTGWVRAYRPQAGKK